MEREISSGAMLGVVLIALAAIITLGFSIFAIAKGVANQGELNVQDSLKSVSDQAFLDYDQKVVSGIQVVSALKSFEGKPYAVLVSTNALNSGRDIAPATIRPAGVYFVNASGRTFVNYNAIIALNGGTSPVAITPTDNLAAPASGAVNGATLALKNGSYVINNGFAANNGNIVYDEQLGGVYNTGNAEYVSDDSKFQANLIKDTAGNDEGVALQELAN